MLSLVALVWAVSGLISLAIDDSVSVTSDTRVRRTVAPAVTSTSSSSTSTSVAVTTTEATSTTVEVTSTTQAPVTVAPTTTSTVAEEQPEPSIEEICPEGLHPDGTGFCIP